MERSREPELVTISARITISTKEIIDKYLRMNGHVTFSEFLRAAIESKLEKDAPQLLKGRFDKEKPKKRGV